MKLKLYQKLERTFALNRQGEVREAEGLYLDMPGKYRSQSDSDHKSGVLKALVGKASEALLPFSQSSQENPTSEVFLLNCVKCLSESGRILDAERAPKTRQGVELSSSVAEGAS